MKLAPSLSRWSTVGAISSGRDARPETFCAKNISVKALLSAQCWVIGVTTKPGAMQLVRMPAWAYSTAAALVSPATACFIAQ